MIYSTDTPFWSKTLELCMWICVCMYVGYVYAYMPVAMSSFVYACSCEFICMFMHMHKCIYGNMSICMLIHMSNLVHMHSCMFMRVDLCTYKNKNVHVYPCTYYAYSAFAYTIWLCSALLWYLGVELSYLIMTYYNCCLLFSFFQLYILTFPFINC